MNVRGVLDRDERAPAVAREFVATALEQSGRAAMVPDAMLLVDELVTNALQHVRYGPVQLDIACVDGTVRVDVSDTETDFIENETSRSPRGLPRLGLRIVDSVADRWGVLFAPAGKSVWFELDGVAEPQIQLAAAVA